MCPNSRSLCSNSCYAYFYSTLVPTHLVQAQFENQNKTRQVKNHFNSLIFYVSPYNSTSFCVAVQFNHFQEQNGLCMCQYFIECRFQSSNMKCEVILSLSINFENATTFSNHLQGFQFLQILHPQGTQFNSLKLHLLEHFG